MGETCFCYIRLPHHCWFPVHRWRKKHRHFLTSSTDGTDHRTLHGHHCFSYLLPLWYLKRNRREATSPNTVWNFFSLNGNVCTSSSSQCGLWLRGRALRTCAGTVQEISSIVLHPKSIPVFPWLTKMDARVARRMHNGNENSIFLWFGMCTSGCTWLFTHFLRQADHSGHLTETRHRLSHFILFALALPET